MTSVRRLSACGIVAAAAGVCSGQNVAQNDMVVGWNQGIPGGTSTPQQLDRTIELFSAAGVLKQDQWNTFSLIQALQWDNYGGIPHNPNGYLIAIDFGNAATGGKVYRYQSGTGWAGTEVFNVGAAPGFITFGLTTTRLAGPTVSPDNTKVAMAGYDTGGIIVFDYDDQAGTFTAGRESSFPQPLPGGRTHGTGWLDNNTVITMSSDGRVQTVDATTMAATLQMQIATPNTNASEFLSLAYAPSAAPYIYSSYSTFTGAGGTPPNVTINKLYVIDPRTTPWTLAREIDLSLSANTLRSIALDSHANLFFTQFGNAATPPQIQRIANAGNPAALQDNSSVTVYTSTFGASFSGLDIALGEGGKGPACYANCDESTAVPFLNVNDFVCFQQRFAAGDPYANCDGSTAQPVLNVNDFVCFQQRFAAGCSAP